MDCLGCGYQLSGLNTQICPECGRRFSAADESTHELARASVRLLEKTTKWCVALAMLPWCIALVCAIIAWLILGHWPQPTIDDPKSIPVVQMMQPAFLVSGIVSLATWAMLIGLFFLWAVRVYQNRSSRAAVFALLCVCILLLVVLLVRNDPLQIITWIGD